MNYEEGTKGQNLYPEASALITPPKDPKDQPLIAANPVPDPSCTSNSLKPSCRRTEAPFTPIKTATENDFEPLPFRDNIFEGSPNNTLNNHLWQIVYSPLQVDPNSDQTGAENEDGEQKKFEGDHGYNEVLLTPRNPDSQNDEPKDNSNKMQPQSKDKVKGDGEKPPSYPHNHWQMYPPPPYYWYGHHYNYGYHHHYGTQHPHPALYPKPQNGHYPAYRSHPAPYGRFGKTPIAAGRPQQIVTQEYITEVTNNDVICGRGGAVNNHPGNRRFRQFIAEFKHQYLSETKQKKPFVAMRVLEAVKNSNPPGRFLIKYPEGYVKCGDDRAREKASQALREGAAKLRKQGYKCVKYGEDHAHQKRGLTKIHFPNERAFDQSYCDDPEYSTEFEPPRKKIKQEAV